MDDAVMVTEPKLAHPGPRIVFVNRAFTAMTGYAPDEILGKTPRVLYGANTDRSLLARLLEDLKRDRKFAGESILCRKDGSEFVFEWQIVPLLDTDGRPRFWLSIQRDASRWKNAENALRDSEKRIRTITDSLPWRIAYLDKDFRYRFNNKAYETCFGFKSEDIHGKHVKEVFGEENFERVKDNTIRALNGEFMRYELTHNFGGHRKIEEVSYVPDLDTDGAPKGIYILITDITDRKRAENQIRTSKVFLDNVLDAIDDLGSVDI